MGNPGQGGSTVSEKDLYEKFIRGERLERHETLSGIPVKPVYRPEDIKGLDYARDLGDPGQYPFARGIFSDMYRGRFWTERPLTGFGTPRLANERIKFLYQNGAVAWNLAPDAAFDVGLDPDHPLARHEVGMNGVNMCCLEDMDTYLAGLPLGKISVNMVLIQPKLIIALCAAAATPPKRLAYLTTIRYAPVVIS